MKYARDSLDSARELLELGFSYALLSSKRELFLLSTNELRNEKKMDNKQTVDNIRQALGTLSSQRPEKSYEYVSAYDERACTVNLVEAPDNPYKYFVRCATSTWGDGELGLGHGSTQKWEKLSPQSRFIVALSVLTGNTLPVPAESFTLLWEFNGFPRHTFDQFARVRVGAGICSIGSRDNNKLDAPFVLYPELYDDIQNDFELRMEFEEWVRKTKDLYERILNANSGSWQVARAVLPLSYSHSWTAYTSFATLKGQMATRLKACEESPIVLLFWKMHEQIADRWPLIANSMRPGCDFAKRCTYRGGADSLTKYFSNLFKGCGRWPDEAEYTEWNRSCSNPEELKLHAKYVEPSEYQNFTESDYDKLDSRDKKLFEDN